MMDRIKDHLWKFFQIFSSHPLDEPPISKFQNQISIWCFRPGMTKKNINYVVDSYLWHKFFLEFFWRWEGFKNSTNRHSYLFCQSKIVIFTRIFLSRQNMFYWTYLHSILVFFTQVYSFLLFLRIFFLSKTPLDECKVQSVRTEKLILNSCSEGPITAILTLMYDDLL